MATTVINKAGIQPIPTDRYSISTSEVVTYLQDQLGFGIGCDFTRWTGVSVDQSYVRMRAVFNPNDIIATTSSRDYVDRVLAENAAGIMFKDTVINTLKPFMYPDTINDVRNHPDDINRLYQIGVFGERFDEILRYSKLTYCREANMFRIYLRPERIIAEMLADPSTGKIDGDMSILAVNGTTSETIRWEVAITKNNHTFVGSTDLSIDAIFNRA